MRPPFASTEGGRRVVLVEPDAHLRRGHAGDQLVALADASQALGTHCSIVAGNTVDPELRAQLAARGATIIDIPSRWQRAGLLAGVAEALFRLSEALDLAVPARQWARRCLKVSRAAREAAALSVAARAGPATVVVLSANERLTALTTFLSGRVPHLRVVHDVTSPDGSGRSVLDHLVRVHRRSCLALCTTEEAAQDLRRSQPGLQAVVESFACVDPSPSPTEAQRSRARTALGLDDVPYLALVGGWWPSKDIEVVVAALEIVEAPMGVVVGGAPLDEQLLSRLGRLLGDRLIVLPDQLDTGQKHAIYQGVDFTLVSRRSGARKESGLVADALRFRVPLVVSDHDERLAASLVSQPWAVVFRAGRAESLAGALERAAEGLDIPPAGAQHLVGFRSGTDQLRTYLVWDRVLKERLAARRIRR